MSMWTRFRDVMKANVYHLLERSNDPAQTARQSIAQFTSDLGQIKAETAAVLAEESRAKRALDESSSEMNKLQRYAEKSVQNGDEVGALRFLEKKASLAAKYAERQAAYERAHAKLLAMNEMQTKLVADLDKLQTRYTELQGRMNQAKLQMADTNANASAASALDAMEQQANQAMHEAEAWAEVRGGGQQEEDLDVLIARLEAGINAQPDAGSISTPQQELDTLKQQTGKL